MPDFLLEIGCEEIPGRMIREAEMTLQGRVANLFGRAGLLPLGEIDPSKIETFSSPRRLAVMIADVLQAQADKTERVMGPSLKVAQKDGEPTAAGNAFSKKVGVPWNQLKTVSSAKGEYLSAEVTTKGRTAAEVIAEGLPDELDRIQWPKSMYWREPNERFVRPVRWLVAMLDNETVPLEFDGIRAGRTSRGHRILSDRVLTIPRAGSAAYVETLRAAKVLGVEDRKDQIRKAVNAATGTIPSAHWREDKPLLDTVVNLTEFPSVILGSFDPQFLALPEEVLVTVMRDHQKYFAIEDGGGKLLPHFLAVLNTDGDPQGLIRHGNERVLRARFNDARFFWQTDQKKSLLERLELLRNVTFQKDLGNYYEKTRRVQRLCSWLSEIVKQSGITVRAGVVHKAACLAKTDLTTELVKEFTELQGIVGGLYARVQPLDPSLPESTRFAIADAIYDHYKPESTEDEAPRSLEGAVLSVGDKADTIAGMFALGLVPSGSKDPFALRRQANAVVKVIDKYKLPFHLSDLMRDARAGYQGSEAEKKFVDNSKFAESVRVFFRERLEFYLKSVLTFKPYVVAAVLANGSDQVVDTIRRAEALIVAINSPEAQDLEAVCISFKRIKNILKQASEKKISIPIHPDEGLMGAVGSAEEDLWRNGVVNLWAQYEVWRQDGRYDLAISHAASLRPLLDRFFDEVMVMVDDEQIRANRLAILHKLYTSFSTIADFSEIVTENKN